MYFHLVGSPGRENQRRTDNGGECPATPLEKETNQRGRGRTGECYALPLNNLRPSVEDKSFKKLQREEGTQTDRGREADHEREVPGGRSGKPATGLSPTDSESKDPETALSLTGFLPCRINKQCNPV